MKPFDIDEKVKNYMLCVDAYASYVKTHGVENAGAKHRRLALIDILTSMFRSAVASGTTDGVNTVNFLLDKLEKKSNASN